MRKRKYRKRDAETTRKALVDAVGEILAQHGYSKLNVTKVAAKAGVDKKMVYHYFNSFNNLLKIYINSKDFWKPVLDKFSREDSPKIDNLKDFIISVFREHFNYFSSEVEMQAFILWQVSESNPLLRKISDEREEQAAGIIGMTDQHFSKSSISLRAVLAVILGGIYYNVWHASKNGSVVCGIDINSSKGRHEFEQTIDLLINLVWQAAERI
jgi:AcrR family transcriptional regulator